MPSKKTWALQSFLSCLILNSILLVLLFVMAKQVLAALHQWVAPFVPPGNTGLPAEAQAAFTGLSQFLTETEQYLALVVFGLGLLISLVLWLLVMALGHRLLLRTEQEAAATTSPGAVIPDEPARGIAAPEVISAKPLSSAQASPETAVQMLAILQREGRLVDFLSEDLHPYSDDQIGAAVRSIHQGCQAALMEHLDLKPILDETEGAAVTVPHDFDPKAIRLTGNISGDPPFKGTLRHHGWRVLRIELPQVTSPREKEWILAPAEVEIGE